MSHEKEITLVTVSDSNYLTGVAVLFASALANLRSDHSLRAVLLTYDIDDDLMEKFVSSLAPLKRSRFSLIVKRLSKDRLDRMTVARSELTLATYGRLIIPELVDSDKAIYLDCDVIVNRDLSELWSFSFDQYALMAVIEPEQRLHPSLRSKFDLEEHQSYFNSGVMVLDLEKIRSLRLFERCLEIASVPDCHFPHSDQCVLNVVFSESIVQLEPLWNTSLVLSDPSNPYVAPDERTLIHTVFHFKPWYYSRDNARGIIRLFYKYLDMTRWEEAREDEVRYIQTCTWSRYVYVWTRMRFRSYLRNQTSG